MAYAFKHDGSKPENSLSNIPSRFFSPPSHLQHMIKYRYLPFTHGKRTYKGKEDTGKTFAS